MKIMIMKMICVISIIIEVIMSFETYFINNINYEIIYLIYRFLSLFIAMFIRRNFINLLIDFYCELFYSFIKISNQ